MSKHTPGPWNVGRHQIYGLPIESANIQVAFVSTEKRYIESPLELADARLIAAAPELIKLVRAFMHEHETNGGHGYQPSCPNCAWAEKLIRETEKQ